MNFEKKKKKKGQIENTYLLKYLLLLFQFEEAAKEIADEVTAPRPEGEEKVEDIQIMLSSDAIPDNLRQLKVIFRERKIIIPD